MNIDWSQIETVLLDMDGTLLDLHFDNHFWRDHMPQAFAQKHDVDLQEAYRRVNPLFEKWAGLLEWYCVDHWSECLDVDIMALKREVADKIAYRPNAELFLDACNRESQDVRMITNGHRKVLDLKIERTGIDRYFRQMICSHELNYPKERQEFWHCLNRHAPFDPTKTLFIDDSETVLESAAEYGIKFIYSIEKPDSQRCRETASRFPMIDRFPI